jgi:hypothetical protein
MLAYIATTIISGAAGALIGIKFAHIENGINLENEVLDIVTDTPIANQLARETKMFLQRLDSK